MADSGLMFKIIFTIILVFVLSLIISVQGAPTESSPEASSKPLDASESPADKSTTEIPASSTTTAANNNGNQGEEVDLIYDQRQNGTENYRVTVKDIMVIWAPSEALLAAAALIDPQIFLPGGDLFGHEDFLASEKPQSSGNNQNEVTLGVASNQNNTTEAVVKPPEKENEKEPANSTTKASQLKRNRQRHPAFMGPFLRRSTQRD